MPLAPPSLFNTQSSTGWWRRDVWQAAASVCSLMPASACWCGVSRLPPYAAASPVGSGIKGSFLFLWLKGAPWSAQGHLLMHGRWREPWWMRPNIGLRSYPLWITGVYTIDWTPSKAVCFSESHDPLLSPGRALNARTKKRNNWSLAEKTVILEQSIVCAQ